AYPGELMTARRRPSKAPPAWLTHKERAVIDIRTFMLVLAIGNIGFAMLMAGYARSAADNPALRVWAWAKLVQGCAHLLGWLRPDLPFIAVAVAANTALIVGTAIEVGAYCTLFGILRWKRVLYPCAALAMLVFQAARFGHASQNELVILMSMIIALFTGAMALMLLRPGASPLRRLIGLNDAVFFIVMSARGCSAVVSGQMSVFSPSLVQSVTYLTAYLLMIVNGFGFLLLCKEKDDKAMALLATIDSLTGLVNRRAFFERTESARLLATRLRSPIALMMIDIDHFKRLNDRFGHATGDEALCLFAATAQQALREHDIMGRLGGEEFALVLPGTDIDGALQAAERLRCAIAAAVLPSSGNQYSMTVSIGVVVIDPHEHINSALARADHALYAAKSNGRDRIEVGESRLRVVV
ncbi:MAG TPA: GGDEF domain-containing protein, partial [Telluria sp.]|nr:GGDEF domain-containing protein [Telluria sp.]